jgi:hypothetical protein
MSNKKLNWPGDKKNKLHYIMIIDESGSMNPIRQDTINNVTELLQDRKKEGNCFITLAAFNTNINWIYKKEPIDSINIKSIKYTPSGLTNLYSSVENIIKYVSDNKQDDENIIIVILSDGDDNERNTEGQLKSPKNVAKLISEKKEDNWTFTLMSCGLDGNRLSEILNINADAVLTYGHNETGSKVAFNILKNTTKRAVNNMSDDGVKLTYTCEDQKKSLRTYNPTN